MSAMEQDKQHILYVWGKHYKRLFETVNISSLVFFRIAFGIIMLVEVYRYFNNNWIQEYWIEPTFNFAYYPFQFLEPLPGDGMIILFWILGVLSVFITLGFLYRISILSFFVGFTYVFLLEQTRYLNHFYLICLISFVMCFLPAHRNFSLDSLLFKKIKSYVQPLWSLWLLRFMIGLPFFFGGIAKINYDWLTGQPLSIWLLNDVDFPIIGQYFTEKWMILSISYAGLFLDLFLVPLLLFRKTRIIAFCAGLLFNIINANLFNIGIFPWFMIVGITLFFNPSWHQKVLMVVGYQPSEKTNPRKPITVLTKKQKVQLTALFIWALLMILIPLRHFIIPGNVSWTEEGHNYSWHMKLRTKRGKGYFVIQDKNQTFKDFINIKYTLKEWQSEKVLVRPKLIWVLANKLKESYAKEGYDVTIFADVKATLNGREYQQFINPKIDITSVPYPFFRHASWIAPLY